MGASFPHKPSTEASSAKLRQLSDEVNRIAATLARLAIVPGSETSKLSEAPANFRHAPNVPVDTVRQAIRARRLRAQYFNQELFADPAWDMLLDLYLSELSQLRVPVSSLCVAAEVPATTALRWISTMTDAGLFKRRPDPTDGRRIFMELTPHASEAMRRYFLDVGKSQSH